MQQKEKDPVIRRTASVCPACGRGVKARIAEKDGRVVLEKRCPGHGDFSLVLSRHPAYYRSLHDFYFALMPRSLPQRDYIIHLTNRCDLNCPICLADANQGGGRDYPLEELRRFLRGRKNCKIDLMGAEPAVREDLPEIIRLVRRSGNISALHTNGTRIADYGYLKILTDAGLQEVHLQFDGFDDGVYEAIRGRKLLEEKKKALSNLDRLNVATDLVMTIVRGINEKEIGGVLAYAAGHSFVREVFFLGCRFLGKAKDGPLERCLMPDEVIDMLEEQTRGIIAREQVRLFQKVYYALLAAFSVRKCFYIQHYVIARTRGGYQGLDRIFDLKGIGKDMDRFKRLRLRKSGLAVPYLLAVLFFRMFSPPGSFLNPGRFLGFCLPFMRGFNLSRLPRSTILIGFISACDAYSFDHAISRNCGKGAVSCEFGVQDSGAVYNVRRESAGRRIQV